MSNSHKWIGGEKLTGIEKMKGVADEIIKEMEDTGLNDIGVGFDIGKYHVSLHVYLNPDEDE